MRTVRYEMKNGKVTENFATAKAEGIKAVHLLPVDETPESVKLQMREHALKAEQKRRERARKGA